MNATASSMRQGGRILPRRAGVVDVDDCHDPSGDRILRPLKPRDSRCHPTSWWVDDILRQREDGVVGAAILGVDDDVAAQPGCLRISTSSPGVGTRLVQDDQARRPCRCRAAARAGPAGRRGPRQIVAEVRVPGELLREHTRACLVRRECFAGLGVLTWSAEERLPSIAGRSLCPRRLTARAVRS